MVGPYRVTDQLGAGGMATVYKAYHARLDRYVALKVMHHSFREDLTFRARFEREAQIVAKLTHPNIVPVYDFSDHENQPYLVLKYIEGKTLKAVMSQGALSRAEIGRIMSAIADALTYAHRQGVLHRDIKPSNIILDESGTPYLTDFGLARIAQAGESTMSADVMLGTPQYISPEQAKGLKDLDARTDVYSFGIVLYELVCGRVPFNADTPYATIHDHIYSPLPPPSQLNPQVSAAVENVLLKALAKEPAERYGSTSELMQAFGDAERGGNAAQAVKSQPSSRQASLPAAVQPAEQEKPKISMMPPLNIPMPPAPLPPLVPPGFEQQAERFAGNVEKAASRFERRMERRAERFERRMERWTGADNSQAKRKGVQVEIKLGDDLDDDEKRDLELDLATDEESIRRRVAKRLKDRRDLIGHAVSYLIVNMMLWVIFGVSGANFPWPMFVTLGWGSGLAAHVINIWSKSNRQLEKRDDDVDTVMMARYGSDWQATATPEEFQQVRRLVYVRHKKRTGFFAHAAVFACINLMLWGIFGFSDADFPWPMFVTLGWGIGLVSNALSAFGQSTQNLASQEEQIQREIERERQRLGNSAVQKRKHDELDAAGEPAPPLRLTDEGELTDSFVEEWDEEQKRKRQ
jgi:serine/threonine protein kinase